MLPKKLKFYTFFQTFVGVREKLMEDLDSAGPLQVNKLMLPKKNSNFEKKLYSRIY